MHQHTMTHKHEHISHDHHAHKNGLGHVHHMQDFKKRFIVSLIITMPILLLSPMIQQWFGFTIDFNYKNHLVLILSSVIYLYGGKPFLVSMADEIRSTKPGMMTLISMAITVAYFYSVSTLFLAIGKPFFWELATLIDIMLLGHYIEAKSILSAGSAMQEMVKLIPQKAVKVTDDGVYEEVNIDLLEINDIILVRPGDKVPADGVVIEGESMHDEAFLTGESKPVYKAKNNNVYMGSTNLDGALKVKISKSGKESYLSEVIHMMQEAAQSKSRTQDLANKAAGWLFYLSLSVATLTFIIWSIVTSSSDAVLKSITVLIIACPHALGLAVPLVSAISTSLGAKKGILIRNRKGFEKVRHADIVCFDKTGTITDSKLAVKEHYITEDEEEMLTYVLTLEQNSEHSIAKAIVAYLGEKNIKRVSLKNFIAFPGVGAKAEINGKSVMVGGMQLLQKESLEIPEFFNKYEKQAASKVWLVVDKKITGLFLLEDTVRSNAQEVVSTLEKMGIKSIMLTGDNEQVASEVAALTGIRHYHSNLLPGEKVAKIEALQKDGSVVAMVGDGINDAPALLKADIGIAIGAGTDIAIESADIILTNSELLRVKDAVILSQKTYRKMVQNLWWASGYNIMAIPLAAGIFSSWGISIEPAVGAIMMSLSTVIVAINAQLLR